MSVLSTDHGSIAASLFPPLFLMLRCGAIVRSNPPKINILVPKSSLLDRFLEQWYRLPQPVRFFTSGNLGNLIFFFIEKAIALRLSQQQLSPSLQKYQDSVSFFVAYFLQVVPQHFLNALLVYGLSTIDTAEKYWKTLGGTYSALTVACIGSTILNGSLLQLGLPKTAAFGLTMFIFACINYFVLGYIVRSAARESKTGNRVRLVRGGGRERVHLSCIAP